VTRAIHETKFTNSRTVAVIPTTLSITVLSLFLTVAPSDDNSKAAQLAIRMANQPATKAMYTVYAAGCSRSFRKVGSYDNLNQARRVAQEHRQGQRAWIATGNERGAWYLTSQVGESLKLEGCSVYTRSCRAGMKLHSKAGTLQQATTLAEQLRKDGIDVEIVYHLK
jgi:hypothetical protein